MKTKILSLLTAIVFVLTAVQGAFAAEINMESKEVKVDGKVSGVLDGTRYLAKVYNPEVTENKDTTDFADWYSYIYQGETGTDGAYGFEYVLQDGAASGKYEIEIVLEDGSVVDDYFYYFTQEYSDEVAIDLTKPAGDTDEEKLSNLLTDLEDFDIRICLDTDFTSYDELTDKSAAAKELLDYGEVSGRAEFKKVFSGIEAAYRVKEAEADEVDIVLSRAADAIGLSGLSTYEEYLELSAKTKANEFMISSKATNGEELIERLSFYIISTELDEIENWQLCRGVLEKYNDILEIDFTEFDESNSQYAIIDAFLDADYNSTETIASCFNKAVSDVDDEDDDDAVGTGSGSKHNSSSSGSRGGSGSGGRTMVVETPEPENQAKDEEKAAAFPGVSDSHWAKEYITELAESGVVSGDENGNFNPDSSITREEFVKLLVLALDIPEAQSYVPFNDVDESSWSSEYIQSAREQGIVSGTEDGRFLPQDAITRQDLFTIVGRYLTDGEAIEYIAFGFADEETAEDYAKPYIAYLANEGLITGYADNTVNPLGNCTRAEAAAMICRIASALGK